MQIEISTDSNIEGREKLSAHVKTVVEDTLSRFSKRITRVEVHLTDVNGHKDGHDDTRCMMEARLEGPSADRRHPPGGVPGPGRRRRRRQIEAIDREHFGARKQLGGPARPSLTG